MIVYDRTGLRIKGVLTMLHNVYIYFEKDQIILDSLKGHFKLSHWDSETKAGQKLHDLQDGHYNILSSDLAKYMKLKENVEEKTTLNIIENRIGVLEDKIDRLADIIYQLSKSQYQMQEKLQTPTFIGLKTIAKSFQYKGKSLYTLGSLRNMIKKEKIGSMEIGSLDILSCHVTLIKRGRKWLTPSAHWLDVKTSIDYDFINTIRSSKANALNAIEHKINENTEEIAETEKSTKINNINHRSGLTEF